MKMGLFKKDEQKPIENQSVTENQGVKTVPTDTEAPDIHQKDDEKKPVNSENETTNDAGKSQGIESNLNTFLFDMEKPRQETRSRKKDPGITEEKEKEEKEREEKEKEKEEQKEESAKSGLNFKSAAESLSRMTDMLFSWLSSLWMKEENEGQYEASPHDLENIEKSWLRVVEQIKMTLSPWNELMFSIGIAYWMPFLTGTINRVSDWYKKRRQDRISGAEKESKKGESDDQGEDDDQEEDNDSDEKKHESVHFRCAECGKQRNVNDKHTHHKNSGKRFCNQSHMVAWLNKNRKAGKGSKKQKSYE